MTNNTARRLDRARRDVRRVRPERRQDSIPRPFLKWVGGKGQLLDRLRPHIPARFGAYHEPFVGGGALFFALWRDRRVFETPAYLSDVNPELVDTYRALRDDVDSVIKALRGHHYEERYYYDTRALDPWQMPRADRAARMIYLNRSGFNGLYRVNKSGGFNVPFGRYTNPTICDEANLRAVSAALSSAAIMNDPFDGIVERARPGDLVYLDPPYVPVSRTSNFVSYAKTGFTTDDQETLATAVETLVDRGVFVMLSNSDTPWVRKRYCDLDVHRVPARRNINCNAKSRGPVNEVVVVG